MATARQRKAAEAKSAKARDAFVARYDAAGQGRRLKGWNPPSQGPARVIEGVERIRSRARDSVRNDWAGESVVQKWTTSLIGIGITPRWEADDLNVMYRTWTPEADADGVLDIYGMQNLATRSWFASGEVFTRRRPRSLDAPLSAPIQVQLIESEYCPMLDATVWVGMPAGNRIRQGVEFNSYGRRVAYWMYKEHPGEMMNRSPTPDQLIRISASDVSHMFEPKRPGQIRGVSELATVLVRLRSSADFEDAVLDRQKLANLFVAFLKRPTPPDTADIEHDSLTGLPKYFNADGNPLAGLEPGLMQELQPGEDVTFANPPDAGTTYADYMRSNGLGTAAGQGLPYELMSGDIQNISDRALRVVINEFRRYCEQRQWQIVIPRFCQPVVGWWAEALALAGKIPLSRLDEAKNPEHQPHGWEYLHPVQDVEGKLKAIAGGLTSKSAEISRRGDDPKKVMAQRAADMKAEQDLGLPTGVDGTSAEPDPADPAEPDPSPSTKPKPKPKPKAAGQHEIYDLLDAFLLTQDTANSRMMAMMEAQAAAAAQVQASTTELVRALLASREPVAQAESPALVSLAASMAAMAMRPAAEVNVLPSPVVTEVTVVPAPVNLTVEPTPISNVVNVEPTAVHVMPAGQTTSKIERDEDGNIVRVTQTPVNLQ